MLVLLLLEFVMAKWVQGSTAHQPTTVTTPQTNTLGGFGSQQTPEASSDAYYSMQWGLPEEFAYNTPANVTYVFMDQLPNNPILFVCQTNASSGAEITLDNTWSTVEFQSPCIYNYAANCSFQLGSPVTIPVTFEAGDDANQKPATGFFFCMGSTTNNVINNAVCDSYSELFSILSVPSISSPTMATPASATDMPSSAIAIPNYTPVIAAVGAASIVSASPVTTSSVIMAVSSSPTAQTTVTTSGMPSSTSTTSSVSMKADSKSSLSVGAKVGIALGALALVALLLLLALFFLRRKHSKRATEHHQPEQVMLTRSMHTDSFGRPAIITEKEEAISSAAALNRAGDSPVHGSGGGGIPEVVMPAPVPQTRHTVLSPYDPIPSAPYTGTIGTSNNNKNNIPRRKPTATTMASTVSRGLSTASSVSAGPISPRSAHTGSGTTASGSGEFEAYHDVRVYGDARHVPQVFSATRIPFLGEETQGMSPEEVARLEEEERRIDLAIAEAERR